MCGRFIVAYTLEELKAFLKDDFNIFDLEEEYEPRYNIAPGENVLSIISDGISFRAGYFKWGFIPSHVRDPKIGFQMINARSETIHKLPTFQSSFQKKRCLIIASGFYEWDRQGKEKIPYLFKHKDNKYFLFAGLYSKSLSKDNQPVYSCTILTTEANGLLKDIHKRMPVIINKAEAKDWLYKYRDETDLRTMLKPYTPRNMVRYRVSQKVNNSRYKNPDCIDEFTPLTLF